MKKWNAHGIVTTGRSTLKLGINKSTFWVLFFNKYFKEFKQNRLWILFCGSSCSLLCQYRYKTAAKDHMLQLFLIKKDTYIICKVKQSCFQVSDGCVEAAHASMQPVADWMTTFWTLQHLPLSLGEQLLYKGKLTQAWQWMRKHKNTNVQAFNGK